MNIAVIFAGGTGQRMNSVAIPKQFLVVHGKPILVHTLEKFQNCSEVDKIIVVSLESYIDTVKQYKDIFGINKLVDVVVGGATGQESIFNGLVAVKKISSSNNDIVLIHDGVRPIIDNETIIKNIECVKTNGSAITVARSIETALIVENDNVEEVIDRSKCFLGRAPQSFYLSEILEAHNKALKMGKRDFIDSAMLMKFFGKKLFTVDGPAYNIKVTTQLDFFMFKAMLDAKENEQLRLI